MSAVLTRNLLAQLKLKGMSADLDRSLKEATEQQLSCTEFVNVLLQAEVDSRSERKVNGLIKKAKFPVKARLEDFDFTAKRSLTRPDIKDLRDMEWLRQGRPLLLVGQTGVGKTFLAEAVGMHACLAGYSAMFLSITQWLEELAMARATGTYLQWRERLVRPSVLVLDNFGSRKLVAMEAQDLCEILDARTGERSTVITTQLKCGALHFSCNAKKIVMRLMRSKRRENIYQLGGLYELASHTASRKNEPVSSGFQTVRHAREDLRILRQWSVAGPTATQRPIRASP